MGLFRSKAAEQAAQNVLAKLSQDQYNAQIALSQYASQNNQLMQAGINYPGTTLGNTTTITTAGIGTNAYYPPIYPAPIPQLSSYTLDFIVDMIFAAVQKAMEEDMRRIIREELASEKVEAEANPTVYPSK